MSIDSPFSLDERLDRLLGKRPAAPLAKLGLETTGDLLRHYPRRYADPGTMTEISILVVGEHVTVVAEIVSATVREMRTRGGAMLQAVVTDGTDRLTLTFFAKHKGALRTHEQRLKPGRTGLFTGVVSEYRNERQLTHPDYLLHGVDVDSAEAGLVEASRLTPIYPASAAMPTWKLHQTVRTVLDPLTAVDIPDPIPAEVLERRELESLHQAFRDIHVPTEEWEWRRGQKRLRYEEAFVLQTALALRRSEAASLEATARPLRTDGPSLLSDFDASLPFTLTAGQREVGAEIAAELAAPHPMQRLLQGEVGSGKTVVALRAMLQVVDAGGQAALLAPTEVLAAQHARTLTALLGDLAAGGMLGGASHGTRVALVTGSQPAAVKKKNLLDAASGAAGIVVGTHALLSAGVQFAELGLVVVDEQHRFGVEQRDMLRAKARTAPHLLVMTATPIPRTVAMTVFGDLETSTLREIPAGRSGITTYVVPAQKPAWISRTWAKVREEIDAGRQAYVVCPRITGDTDDTGDSDDPGATDEPASADGTLGVELPDGPSQTGSPGSRGTTPPATSSRRPLRAVLEVAEELADLEVLHGVRIGILHGQMPPAEKEAAMAAFTAGDVDLLVSTTVIEVGVDVPRATAMVVLDADRFGLSQLHQLRGRVGRGADAGLCFLVSEMAEAAPASTRLKTLAATTDGFELAAADLEMRSEGDVLGAAQSGRSTSLQLLRVVRDTAVIEQAREDAAALVTADPTLDGHPVLLAEITERVTGERAEYLDRS